MILKIVFEYDLFCFAYNDLCNVEKNSHTSTTVLILMAISCYLLIVIYESQRIAV